jgi:hypothetical protein
MGERFRENSRGLHLSHDERRRFSLPVPVLAESEARTIRARCWAVLWERAWDRAGLSQSLPRCACCFRLEQADGLSAMRYSSGCPRCRVALAMAELSRWARDG